ncbi:MAG: N-acetyl-gamma-glutamyl-phosphate reductase [Bacillota bacterium]
MIKVGVIGSTGYAGQQLVWLLNRHRQVHIVFLSSHNNTDMSFSEVYPQYVDFIHNNCIDIHSAEELLPEIDALFIALPHGKAFDITAKALALGVKVIDLGADFRIKHADIYQQWYNVEHTAADLLDSAVYGLPELHRDAIKKADLIANPGCYPTASILALVPLLKESLIDPTSIIIDAKSGVSGAGRSLNLATLYTECNESIKAYGIASHRHTPEIEQELSLIGKQDITLSFTPHLTPMNRGILATCYANVKESMDTEALYKVYQDFYHDEFFVKVVQSVPETRYVKGTNFCHIGLKADPRTGRVIVVSAIDNLIKGAAGQALQNMNLLFGIDETEGLELLAMVP